MGFSKQLPQGVPFIDKRNMIDYRWAAILNQAFSSLPPAGVGYVVDGSATTYAEMVLYQGLDANKGGSPSAGEIYFALDTGTIYFASGGNWYPMSEVLTGDVSKPANSTTVTLNTVNPAVGTWGDVSNYPVITVNEKGLVTNVTLESVSGASVAPGGTPYSVQYNDSGVFGGDGVFVYDPFGQTLTVRNVVVNGTVSYFNRVPNQNNLLPVQTGLAGYVLETDGTNVSWQPTGTFEMIFNYGDATPKNLMIIPADKIIQEVAIILMTAFNDTSTLSIGDVGDVNRLMATTDNTTSAAGTYTVEPAYKYAVNTQITLSITAGASTQGNGLVVITYQK